MRNEKEFAQKGTTLFFPPQRIKEKMVVCLPVPGSHVYARFHAKLPLGHVPATQEQLGP